MTGSSHPPSCSSKALTAPFLPSRSGLTVSAPKPRTNPFSLGRHRNRVLANTIQTATGLPIDLGLAGPTPDDALDADTGPNALQNYPVVLHAHRTAQFIWIEGTLDTSANAAFRLDFYWGCCADAIGRGMPVLSLGNATTPTDGAGHAHFWARLPSPALQIPTLSLGAISATATDTAGDTSEVGTVATEDTDLIYRDDLEHH